MNCVSFQVYILCSNFEIGTHPNFRKSECEVMSFVDIPIENQNKQHKYIDVVKYWNACFIRLIDSNIYLLISKIILFLFRW